MSKKDKKRQKQEAEILRSLGNETVYEFQNPTTQVLETFPNPAKENYVVTHRCEEFTSLCPVTSQPDYATIHVCYCPDKLCIESKSLKLYLMQYRNEGAFMEKIVNQIADHLCSVLKPETLTVQGDFNSRGGIKTSVAVNRIK